MSQLTAATNKDKTPAGLARAAIDMLEPSDERVELGRQRMVAVWRRDANFELPILLGGSVDTPDPRIPEVKSPPNDSYPWRQFDHAEQFDDADKMLVEAVWALLAGQGNPDARGDTQVTVRANFGTVVAATTFGVEALPLSHTLPWIAEHLSRDEIIAAIKRIDPETAPERGLAAAALDRTAYFREQLAGKAQVYSVNNQSPLDIAHLVRGEELYLDMYDDPPFVHDLLSACTEVYISLARAFKLVLDEPDTSSYNGSCFREGCGVHASDDTASVLGPDLFEEFGVPYDCKAFAPFGGGSIHFCGRAEHIIGGYLGAMEVRSINFGQPGLYNQVEVAPRIASADKVYVGKWPVLDGETIDAYFLRVLGTPGSKRFPQNRNLRGNEFGVSPEKFAERWYAYQREN